MNKLKEGQIRQYDVAVYPIRLKREDSAAIEGIMAKADDKDRIAMLCRLIHEELARLRVFEQQER